MNINDIRIEDVAIIIIKKNDNEPSKLVDYMRGIRGKVTKITLESLYIETNGNEKPKCISKNQIKKLIRIN